jgi:hypothetical protein
MAKQANLKKRVADAADNAKLLDIDALVEEFGSRSAAVRAMNAEEIDTATIAKVTGMSYQEVRGLLARPLAGETPEDAQERVERGKKVTDARGNYGVQNLKDDKHE